jgi:hypothetical protein
MVALKLILVAIGSIATTFASVAFGCDYCYVFFVLQKNSQAL